MSSSSFTRAALGLPTPPVRLAHLGLGNFHRAHQAWYTHHAPDAADWGYAAFTGHSTQLAEAMNGQDGLYTLLIRSDQNDAAEVIGSIVQTHPGTDSQAWQQVWQIPELAVVTITVTEAGYVRAGDGIDLRDDAVAADVTALQQGRLAKVSTAPGKLLAGMMSRRQAGLGPLTILSCDNLPANGAVVQAVTRSLAAAVDDSLPALVDQYSFATSMVDRITPRTTEEDIARVESLTGHLDAAPVVTEPFSEWVISGDFIAGCPQWDQAGAVMVEDVEPFERRKLWLLNGSHTLLAYAGSLRGHETVAQAVADPQVQEWVQQWWNEACRHLTLPQDELTAYRQALVERFSNTQIRHLLSQIASDGSQKIPVRILPTLQAERADGRDGTAALRVIAAWIRHLQGQGVEVKDSGASRFQEGLAQASDEQAAQRVLELLDAELAKDDQTVETLTAQLGAFGS